MSRIPQRIVLSILVVALAASVTSCTKKRRAAREGELVGTISISGAFAMYPLAVKWAGEFTAMHPYVKIDISAGGAGKGITDALAGQVDFGMVSREIYPQEMELGALPIPLAQDAVVATVNTGNPHFKEILRCGITKEKARRLWICNNVKTWGDMMGTDNTTPIHIYTRADACGAAATWAQWFGYSQEDLNGIAVFGDPGIASIVQNDRIAIGINNVGYVYDEETRKPFKNIAVIPVDTDNDGKISKEEEFYGTKDTFINAVKSGKYPFPPARNLYFVSKGWPQELHVLEFLKYVMTQGQKQNIPAGFIDIPADKLQQDINTIDSMITEVCSRPSKRRR